MKKILFAVLASLMLAGGYAFTTLRHYADIFRQLQMQPDEVKEIVFGNFQDGLLSVPYSKLVTQLAVGKREAAVKEIGDYIKAYSASPEFAERYKEAREAARPQGVASSEEKIKAKIEQVKNDIGDIEATLPKQNSDMKKLYEFQLKELKKELKSLSDPSDPAHGWYAKKAAELKGGEQNQADEDLKYWQQDYPPTVNGMVKKRLTEFLDFTKDIDFTAKLVRQGNKMIFADPALEAKDETWKRCFRCGKETITAARSYAQQWLASIK